MAESPSPWFLLLIQTDITSEMKTLHHKQEQINRVTTASAAAAQSIINLELITIS